jgi:hypothetical protein
MRLCDCEPSGTLAVVIIAGPSRVDSCLPEVVRSAQEQEPDELVVIGDRLRTFGDLRVLNVEPLTRTTIDALVKRDVGFVATTSRFICYLADDHRLGPNFVKHFRERYADRDDWDLLAPQRFTVRGQQIFNLNVGKDLHYIGGHCGIYRRSILRQVPWSASRHHPNWDVWHSHDLVKAGGKLVYTDIDLAIEDIEPGARPWM